MSLYDAVDRAGLLNGPPAAGDLLSPQQAAAIIGVSRRRVRDFIAAGRIAAVNLGGAGRGARYVLRRDEVERFAALGRRGGRPVKHAFDRHLE